MYRGRDLIYLNLNLWEWVKGTIDKICLAEPITISEWNGAWERTYFELGGKKRSSGTKGCPKKAAYTLYYLGRITGTNRPCLDWSYQKIKNELSKNGVYAILAVELLKKDPDLNLHDLWLRIKEKYKTELNDEPAESNQGGSTVAFKLFHNKKLISQCQLKTDKSQ